MWVLGARFRSFTWIALALTAEPSHLFLSRLFFYANFSFTRNSYEEKINKILLQSPFHAHTCITSSAILSYRCPCPTRDNAFLTEGHIIPTQWAWLTYLHTASHVGMHSWGCRQMYNVTHLTQQESIEQPLTKLRILWSCLFPLHFEQMSSPQPYLF